MNASPDLALSVALKFLKVAERTESELRTHLESKGVLQEDADRVVAMMLARRFVSDERVVEREIELAKGPRKVGRDKVKAKLLEKNELANNLLKTSSDPELERIKSKPEA